VCGLLCGCESWFGPAEGDAPHPSSAGTGVVFSGVDRCCGAAVRIDGGSITRLSGSGPHEVNLKPGKHTVSIRYCYGSCGGILDPGSCSCQGWSYCNVDLAPGEVAVLTDGSCR